MNLSDAEARMLREALADAIKWGVSYAFMYEELPGDERIQKRVDQLIKAMLDAKAGECKPSQVERFCMVDAACVQEDARKVLDSLNPSKEADK